MDYLIFLACLVLAYVAIHFFISTSKKQLPPGPPPIPIFGNLFSLGTKHHVSFTQLSRTYGPLMTLHLGRVTTVVISSVSMAKEVLQKNDISFSNRNVIDATKALNHHQNSVVWLPVSHQWRNLRKICNSHVFSTSRLETSAHLRMKVVKDLISYVQKRCEDGIAVDIGQAAFTTSLNLLSNTFFSVDMGDPNSKVACDLKETVRGIMEEAGKPNVSDYFPILRKIDPQGIRRRIGIHFGKMIDLFKTMVDQRLHSMRLSDSNQDNGVLDALLDSNQHKTKEIEPSQIPYLLLAESLENNSYLNVDILSNTFSALLENPNEHTAQDLFSAGTHTTSTTLEWAMAELLRNPEKLNKAQSELNKIIGKGNSIQEYDIAGLPYLQAVVKETFRLHPAVPFLVPRKVDSDVQLAGFTIPKNAQVLVNVYAIGRDSEIWENPNSFQPERFMGSEIDVKGRDFELIPFGAGRRICPGLPLAIRMIHLMLGSLIHEFNWKLEGGILPEEMDMEDRLGFNLDKAHSLRAIPVSCSCRM